MKKIRWWVIFGMAVLMLAAAFNCAYALDAGDWEGEWLKGKLSGGGYCDDNGTMAKSKLKGTIYIKIDSAWPSGMDALLFVNEGNKKWQYLTMTLEREMGDFERGVFNTHFIIAEGSDTSDVYLGFLLTGKENKKNGELKKGTLKTICGLQIGHCTMSVSFKGKTIEEKKVPQEVKAALP